MLSQSLARFEIHSRPLHAVRQALSQAEFGGGTDSHLGALFCHVARFPETSGPQNFGGSGNLENRGGPSGPGNATVPQKTVPLALEAP
jgi:hypothetical protein